MSDLRAAAQQALEALHEISWSNDTQWQSDRAADVIPTLRAALAQPEPEPVAWIHTDAYNPKVRFLEWTQQPRGYRGDWIKTPLYTNPPQRKPEWTDADADAARLAMELEALLLSCKDTAAVSRWWDSAHDALELHRQRLARAVEAKHGIKE